jgi:formylglycine-generating enzyme required for sulfatase activity
MHLLVPCEFSADTTELVQMLRRGHHGVKLDAEAWDRLITWIDLNTPAHGTWTEIVGAGLVEQQRARRREMLKRYAGLDEDPEATAAAGQAAAAPAEIVRETTPPARPATELPEWPYEAAEAARRQSANGDFRRPLELGSGVKLDLVLVPAGEFLMGDGATTLTPVKIPRSFWMGRCEISNAQFACFDPAHDSRIERGDFLQFSTRERGFSANDPKQPVVRVSWQNAMAFCQWLSGKTGERCSLPSEAQWEYACRAGTATPLWFGDLTADFAKSANLADHSLRFMTTFGWELPSGAIPPWRPAIDTVNDGFRVAAPVGSFQPNTWGLHDMCGNVWEWTTGDFGPDRKAVRGGSWSARPCHATSTCRLGFRPWQPVYDVGFRVVVERAN